jgi:glucosamine--fructose-6-phosphate aminotransferase (isomerizing)
MQSITSISANCAAADLRVAEQEKAMSRLPMLDNIFGQAESLRRLLAFHQNQGHFSLKSCAELIRNAQGRVILTGMGASLFAATPAVTRLLEAGCPTQLVESAEMLHYGSRGLRQGDVAILISRSGGSVEVLRLAEKLRDAGAMIIGVTNIPGSELERAADATLQINSQPDQLVAVQTYTGTVAALLLLAEQAITGDAAAFAEVCSSALPVLSTFVEDCYRASESWRDWLDAAAPLYLLGRGPALAAVHEGALLLHETAKAAAVGMSSGQFRHGPVEAVSSEFHAVIFGTPGSTRDLDRSLADDLFRMGAKVRWIGNAGVDDGAPSLISWPDVPTSLAPVFEIVPLQCAAYRLALWRAIVPGDFRYASEITAAESGFPLFQAKVGPSKLTPV